MGHWGVKSFENDDADDALDRGFERVHGAAYEELMDDRCPLTFDQVQRKLAGVETLAASLDALRAAAGVGSVEGFPLRAPWLLRQTIGRVQRRRVLGSGTMPAGVQLPKRFVPRPGLDARAEAEALRAALQLYAMSTEPPALHPFFD